MLLAPQTANLHNEIPQQVATPAPVTTTTEPTPSPTATPQPVVATSKPVAAQPVAPKAQPAPQQPVGNVQQIVADAAASRGWVGSEWSALSAIIARESGWNPYASNKSSGACGLFQANPCSKLGVPLSDIQGQARWGLSYIASRYGSPSAAYAHSLRTGWY